MKLKNDEIYLLTKSKELEIKKMMTVKFVLILLTTHVFSYLLELPNDAENKTIIKDSTRIQRGYKRITIPLTTIVNTEQLPIDVSIINNKAKVLFSHARLIKKINTQDSKWNDPLYVIDVRNNDIHKLKKSISGLKAIPFMKITKRPSKRRNYEITI